MGDTSGLFVVNSDGSGEPLKLTTNTANDWGASISGDGSKIAFISDVDGDYGLFVVNSDGSGEPILLTQSPAYKMCPSISGDGSRIVYQSDVGDTAEIFMVNSDGTGLTQITDNNAYDGYPSISGDGTKIAYESEVDGNLEIFVINWGSSMTVSASPSSLTVNVGEEAIFTANVDGGTPPYTYIWSELGVGQVGSEVELRISKDSPGTYDFCCNVEDSTGWSQNSNQVILIVNSSFPAEAVVGAIAVVAVVLVALFWLFKKRKTKRKTPVLG